MQAHRATWTDWVESGHWLDSKDTVLPVSPLLTPEAMSVAQDPDVSVHRIVRLVSKEQVLATRILRMANSASCAPARPITTINDAAVRVGTSAVRHSVLAACVTAQLEAGTAYGRAGTQLLEHSMGTACLASMLAEGTTIEAEEALLCGLLHDIGKLVILKLSRDHPGHLGQEPADDEVDAVTRERHSYVGGQLLRHWRLPEALRDPVRCHHRPDLSVLYRDRACLVYVANRLSHRYGLGCAAEPDANLLEDRWVVEFGLDRHWLADIDRRAPDRLASFRSVVR